MLAALKAYRAPEGYAPLGVVIALHYGTVIYGNIGPADHLDFTVIGPAGQFCQPPRKRLRSTERTAAGPDR
jgi:class 3 adenylate cyclase